MQRPACGLGLHLAALKPHAGVMRKNEWQRATSEHTKRSTPPFFFVYHPIEVVTGGSSSHLGWEYMTRAVGGLHGAVVPTQRACPLASCHCPDARAGAQHRGRMQHEHVHNSLFVPGG